MNEKILHLLNILSALITDIDGKEYAHYRAIMIHIRNVTTLNGSVYADINQAGVTALKQRLTEEQIGFGKSGTVNIYLCLENLLSKLSVVSGFTDTEWDAVMSYMITAHNRVLSNALLNQKNNTKIIDIVKDNQWLMVILLIEKIDAVKLNALPVTIA